MSFISATLGYYWAINSSQMVRNLFLPWEFVSGLHHMHLTIVPSVFQQTNTPRVACAMWVWFCFSQFVHPKLSSYSVCYTMSYALCANMAMGCARWLIDWDQVWAHSHLHNTLAIVFYFVLHLPMLWASSTSKTHLGNLLNMCKMGLYWVLIQRHIKIINFEYAHSMT